MADGEERDSLGVMKRGLLPSASATSIREATSPRCRNMKLLPPGVRRGMHAAVPQTGTGCRAAEPVTPKRRKAADAREQCQISEDSSATSSMAWFCEVYLNHQMNKNSPLPELAGKGREMHRDLFRNFQTCEELGRPCGGNGHGHGIKSRVRRVLGD